MTGRVIPPLLTLLAGVGLGYAVARSTPPAAGPAVAPSTRPPGGLVHTGNPLDVAIQGDGFFAVITPDGSIGYTREGVFGRCTAGLVTAEGFVLIPRVVVPADAAAVAVGSDGTVSAATPAGPPVVLGAITLTHFQNPGWLQPGPDGLWRETAASGPPTTSAPGQDGCGLLVQGFREQPAGPSVGRH